MLVPLDSAAYGQYAALRTSLALNASACIPLTSAGGSPTFGMHPALPNVAAMYNRQRAAVIANVGPLAAPASKAQILANLNLAPQGLFSHPAGINQWESASTVLVPTTGWGGRMADFISSQSGSLPPMFNSGSASIFTVGRSVQGIAVSSQAGSTSVLPTGMQSAIMAIAASDAQSQNAIVAQAAAAAGTGGQPAGSHRAGSKFWYSIQHGVSCKLRLVSR